MSRHAQRSRLFSAVLVAGTLAACAREPAPADTDALARWLFVNAAVEGTDVPGAIAHVHRAYVDLAPGEPIKQTLSNLLPGDVDGVGFPGRDPVDASGMLLVAAIPCTLAELEALVVRADQKELHPGYETYTRTFAGDVAAWDAGTLRHLTFENSYSIAGFGGGYKARVRAEARRVPAWTGGEGPTGPVLVVRATLAEPAEVKAEGDFFRQDYQVQVFYERTPGEVLHFFGTWKDHRFASFDDDTDEYRAITLDQLYGADERFGQRCREN